MSNDDDKYVDLHADVKVLENQQKAITKHHDKLFDVLDGIKTDLSRLVSIEERQVNINDTLGRIENHASKQGKEISDLKKDYHSFDIRLINLENETGSNTDVRKRWGRIWERVAGALIIAGLGAFIALKQ